MEKVILMHHQGRKEEHENSEINIDVGVLIILFVVVMFCFLNVTHNYLNKYITYIDF